MLKFPLIISFLSLIFFSGCSSIAVWDGVIRGEDGSTLTGDTGLITQEFLQSIDFGKQEGAYTVHKFGRNTAVGTSITPVTIGGNYQTPNAAVTLEAVSSSASDTAAGIGARSIIIFGLNASGELINETITMNGVSASAATTKSFLRMFRVYVVESGTYATQTSASQVGVITIRQSGGGSTWAIIDTAQTNFGNGQSQIGAYTVPKGYTCYLMNKIFSVDSARTANIYFFQRQGILDTTAPYSAMRLVEQEDGVSGLHVISQNTPIASFPELTDIGFMAKTATGTASISVDFELACLKDSIYKN